MVKSPSESGHADFVLVKQPTSANARKICALISFQLLLNLVKAAALAHIINLVTDCSFEARFDGLFGSALVAT